LVRGLKPDLTDVLDGLDVEHGAAHPHHVLLHCLPELEPFLTLKVDQIKNELKCTHVRY
jgi:hypothetical protein